MQVLYFFSHGSLLGILCRHSYVIPQLMHIQDTKVVQSAGNGDREEERSSVYLKVTNMGQALWSKDLDFLQGLHIWAFLAWFEK